MGRNNRYILPFFIPHKGCPHRCIFCDQYQVTGSSAPTREEVAAAIDNWRQEPLPEVAFYGGSFTALSREEQAYYLEVTAEAIKQDRIRGVRVSTRPDAISQEELDFLTGFGVDMVELGVQSLEDEVLKKAGRGHTAADTFRAAALLKKAGFHWGVQLMPGLPGEDRARALANAAALLAYQPDTARLYPTLVLQGTPLAALYEAGKYRPLSLMEAVDICRDLLLLCRYYGVDVIRVGLQPTDEIAWGKGVLAGPFHPSFGHLAAGALWLAKAEHLLTRHKLENPVLYADPRHMAQLVGQNRTNMIDLSRRYPGIKAKPYPYAQEGLGLGEESGPLFFLEEEAFIHEAVKRLPFDLPSVVTV